MNGCKIRRYTSPRQYPIVCILPTCLRYSRPTLPAEEYQFGLLTELVWVSDRHGVCPYMRPTGRIGIDWVDGGVYVCRDRPRVCPIRLSATVH